MAPELLETPAILCPKPAPCWARWPAAWQVLSRNPLRLSSYGQTCPQATTRGESAPAGRNNLPSYPTAVLFYGNGSQPNRFCNRLADHYNEEEEKVWGT